MLQILRRMHDAFCTIGIFINCCNLRCNTVIDTGNMFLALGFSFLLGVPHEIQPLIEISGSFSNHCDVWTMPILYVGGIRYTHWSVFVDWFSCIGLAIMAANEQEPGSE